MVHLNKFGKTKTVLNMQETKEVEVHIATSGVETPIINICHEKISSSILVTINCRNLNIC